MKRDPTLADVLISGGPVKRSEAAPSRLDMLQAHRFVLDASASRFFGTLIKKTARLILREHEFARQPFDYTWIEFDARAYAAAVEGQIRNEATADLKAGFMYAKGTVYSCSLSPDEHGGHFCGWLPYRMHLHRPIGGFEQEMELAQKVNMSRLMMRMCLIGFAEKVDDPWWLGDEVTNLVRSHTYEPTLDLSAEVNHGQLVANMGCLKQMLVLLLLLTRPGRHVLHFGEEKADRRWIRNRFVPLVRHNTVKLHLDQSVAMRRFITGIHTGLHRKHHDVRGHWAQTRRLQNTCTHIWDPIDEDHFRCLRCEAKRWWRKDHTRGRIELGTVTKDYEVTE